MDLVTTLILLVVSILTYVLGYISGKEVGYDKGFDDGYISAEDCYYDQGEFLNKANRDAFIRMKSINPVIVVLSIVSIVLAIIVMFYISLPYTIYFFTALLALVIASASMLLFLIIRWRRLTKKERWSIDICIAVWLLLAYGVIYMNGLTLSVRLGL